MFPEEPVGEYDVWIHKGGGNHGERWAFIRKVQSVFNPGDHLLVLLIVDLLGLIFSGWPPSHGQITYEPSIVIDIIITVSEKFGMGKRRVLGATKECESQTVLVPEIALGYWRYLIAVGILTSLLVACLPLPPVIPAKSGCHLEAFVHHESPVALEGSGILQLVHMMREHKDRKVP